MPQGTVHHSQEVTVEKVEETGHTVPPIREWWLLGGLQESGKFQTKDTGFWCR